MPMDMKIKVGPESEDEGECMCGDCYECGATDYRDKALALVGMEPIKKGDASYVQREIVKLLNKIPCGGRRSSMPPSSSKPGMEDGEEEMG